MHTFIAAVRRLRARQLVPACFPLTPANADLAWRLWRMTIGELRGLHETAGLPLRVTGSGNGRRYYANTAAITNWFAETETARRSADRGSKRRAS